MSDKSSSSSSSGIGICGLLFVGLFFLKILEVAPVAGWSWWWVTAPLWGGFVLLLLFLAVVFAIAWVSMWLEERK